MTGQREIRKQATVLKKCIELGKAARTTLDKLQATCKHSRRSKPWKSYCGDGLEISGYDRYQTCLDCRKHIYVL